MLRSRWQMITTDIFYDELERLFNRLPKYNSKIVLGDFNAKVGREEKYRRTISKYSLHEKTSNNGEKYNFRDFEEPTVKENAL